MKVKHFAVSAVENEELSNFLSRLSKEVELLEKDGKKVRNVVLNFLQTIDPTEQIQAVVFYDSKDKTHDSEMDYKEFISEPHDNAVLSLEQNVDSIKSWLGDNKEVEIYDLSTQLGLDLNGGNLAHSIVYYDSNSGS